jgi:protein tyrosine phosphatase (PTP) superfamily phosphohydrolase (DUF442 family)
MKIRNVPKGAACAVLMLAAALAAACAHRETGDDRSELHAARRDPLAPAECGTIGKLHEQGVVWLAGQPSPEDFALAKERGVRTVLNLRHESEIRGFEEPLVVTELGMRYVSLPWNGPDELTDDVFDRARAVLDTAERPLLLHCGSANRVGAVWIPWRVLDCGLSVEDALAEARTIGLRTPEYQQKALEYVARRRRG